MGLRSENLQLSTHMISYAVLKTKEFEIVNLTKEKKSYEVSNRHSERI